MPEIKNIIFLTKKVRKVRYIIIRVIIKNFIKFATSLEIKRIKAFKKDIYCSGMWLKLMAKKYQGILLSNEI